MYTACKKPRRTTKVFDDQPVKLIKMIDQFAGDVGEWEKGNRMTVLFIIREHKRRGVLYPFCQLKL